MIGLVRYPGGLSNNSIDLERLPLAELNHQGAVKFRDRLAFAAYRKGHIYNRITYREWGIRTRQLGGLLRTLGLCTGDRVLIPVENRPEWPIAYFGAALGGFVSVPVLPDCAPQWYPGKYPGFHPWTEKEHPSGARGSLQRS
jgi:acyl-CoA synthetase (AMP-forming)/AMP-acid ligase II